MPVAFITVKLPDSSLVHLDIDLKTRVEEFRTVLAPKSGIKRHKQRLVFAGRLLQDGRSLEAYGIERNSTVHLLHGSSGEGGGEGVTGYDITQTPGQLGGLQRHVLQNPDILQQMLESPAMQSLLNDHDFMRSLLKMDPRLTKLMDGCPELATMMADQEFMKQATEALRNPVHVRDVLRSTDRSMTQLEALGGGSFDVLRQMCEDIRRPMLDEDFASQQQQFARKPSKDDKTNKDDKKKGRKGSKQSSGEGGDEEAEAGDEAPEGSVSAADALDLRPAPEWLGTFDTNAMASMMQDQNMQHLLAQLVQAVPGAGQKVHPDDPFLDSGFLGQMFNAQTISSMTLLQEAVEKLSMAAEPDAAKSGKDAKGKAAKAKEKDDGKMPQDSPQVLSGLNPRSPAANFKESFSLFIQAEQESPEVRYKGQLQAMANMGFTDKEACIQALHNCDGNMNKAVETLMKAQK